MAEPFPQPAMSYLALARKWRPRRFAELVGQEHVVRVLSHALDSGRIHHAYLFAGTRGVGKTTVARIFAKALQCEEGVRAEPCGECRACAEIDAGCHPDLIEIDAASNTGVDHVRELIERAQYAPARGRFKVYLIDEVHMLSRSAFNALLKTLEEPPGHVRFLFATTDPERLPATVLSRCLRLSLLHLERERIAARLAEIAAAEGIAAEPAALAALAEAADGSLRDALSLFDQAIAFGGGEVRGSEVEAMLGWVGRDRLPALLEALAGGAAAEVESSIAALARLAPDFGSLLAALSELLHRLQVARLLPESRARLDPALAALADRLDDETIQLWYQICLLGRRDLPLAPTARIGFEMTVWRMLAFRPAMPVLGAETPVEQAGERRIGAASREPATEASAAPRGGRGEAPPASFRRSGEEARRAPATALPDAAGWPRFVAALGLSGPASGLARETRLVTAEGDRIVLAVDPEVRAICTEASREALQRAVGEALGRPVRIELREQGAEGAPNLAELLGAEDRRRRAQALAAAESDPLVEALRRDLDARLVPDSIVPE